MKPEGREDINKRDRGGQERMVEKKEEVYQ
jgi:hypothetical protein